MEPVTLILTALAAGASAGALDSLKDDVKEKASAAYTRLRDLAARRVSGRPHGELALAEYGAAPQKWESLLSAELTEAGAGTGTRPWWRPRGLSMELEDQAGAAAGKVCRDNHGLSGGSSRRWQHPGQQVLTYGR